MIQFSSIILIPEVDWGIIQKVLYILWNWKAFVSKEAFNKSQMVKWAIVMEKKLDLVS